MAMLSDLLSQVLKLPQHQHPALDNMSKQPEPTADKNSITGDALMKIFRGQADAKEDNVITNDNGSMSTDQSNPFLDAITKSRANNNTGPGVIRQLLNGIMGPTGGPTDPSTAAPLSGGSQPGPQDVSHTPSANQKQSDLAPANTSDGNPDASIPLPSPRPAEASAPENPYAMPTAIDPESIEALRQSLLTDAGQLDPNNPNGLSGRMNSPNAAPEMQNQASDAQGIDNMFRSSSASGPTMKAQNLQPQQSNTALKGDAQPTGQTEPGNIDLNHRPVVHNSDGSISTVRSITITDQNGNAILIPTVIGDKVVSNDAAIKHFQDTGQHLGKFTSEAAADAYAEKLHNDQATQYKGR